MDPNRLKIESGTVNTRGNIKIKFNKKIQEEPLLTYFSTTQQKQQDRSLSKTDDVLSLYVRDYGEDDYQDKKIMDFTYEKLENENKTLSLNVNFENPSSISKDIQELDILDFKVKKQEIFVSAETNEQLLEQDSDFFISLLPQLSDEEY